MTPAKRRDDAEPVGDPTGVTAPQSWSAAGSAPPAPPPPDATVVEGDAVELPPAPPAAGEPVARPGAAAVYASGTAPSWPEPVAQIAAERPEVVVGAAFAGGLLFALILRRLGR